MVRASGSLVVGLALGALSVVSAGAQTPSFTPIPLLPSDTSSRGWAVSNGGNVVVGGGAAPGTLSGLRWDRGVGSSPLPAGAGVTGTRAYGLSADGGTAVGVVWRGTGTPAQRAARWTGSGLSELPPAPAAVSSVAWGVSASGDVVVGESRSSTSISRAFLWTEAGGYANLDTNTVSSQAFAVSGNGLVVGGRADNRAFIWTSTTGTQTLPGIPSAEASTVYGLSADGSFAAVTTGNLGPSPTGQAYRWSATLGAQPLGSLPGGTRSFASSISGDGGAIVGNSDSTLGGRAVLWTPTLGMVDLNSYLPALGLDLAGWTLTDALGISRDGAAIAGVGTFEGVSRPWVAVIPAPTTAAAILPAMCLAARRRRR